MKVSGSSIRSWAVVGFAALGLSVLGAMGQARATEVAGVKLAESAVVQGQTLVLNGAGVRTRVIIKVYVAGLYTHEKTQDAMAVINADRPRRIQMVMLRDLGADALNDALQEGLKKNLSPTALAEVDAEARQLGQMMLSIGKAKEGDVIVLDFSASGVAVQVAGAEKGQIPGAKFSSALLRVWLGDQPADAGLKKAMLGG